jgi:hypothetical protein
LYGKRKFIANQSGFGAFVVRGILTGELENTKSLPAENVLIQTFDVPGLFIQTELSFLHSWCPIRGAQILCHDRSDFYRNPAVGTATFNYRTQGLRPGLQTCHPSGI